MDLLKGKVAIITGAASGIGAETAYTFASNGAKGIVIADINLERAKEKAEYIKKKTDCDCIAVKVDVTEEEQVKNVYSVALDTFGTVDILVNSAGICDLTSIDEMTMEHWDRTLNINLKGTFLFSREALRLMKENKSGKMINLSSQGAKIGGFVAGMDYVSAKGGVLSLTKSFAKAGASYNINVNSVAPGLIATEMTTNFGFKPEMVPLGRIGTAKDIADVILFLASDMSSYITGACIDINGGMSMW